MTDPVSGSVEPEDAEHIARTYLRHSNPEVTP